MLELDLSDGGGQLLRTALSLSALSETPVELTGIRGARTEPGLKHQHLAAVETLAAVTDAAVEGAELGSEQLAFEPDRARGGSYEVAIGTAGSATLLFDAVLPLATAVEESLSVTVRGGTDVKWSPTADYYRHVKLPLLRRHGLCAALELHHRGFYPEGDGAATLRLGPSSLSPVSLLHRGSRSGARVYSVASADLDDSEVADRQAEGAALALEQAGVDVIQRTATCAAATATGSAVVVRLDFEDAITGADALGEPGKPAEAVGRDAVESALSLRGGAAAVDRHMADQLVVPLALAGGEVAIPAVTDHVEANAALVGEFDREVRVVDGSPPRLVGNA